jgi:hypothetical protein
MGRGDKPGQDEWSQGRKAAGEARGYAPSPRGGSKPVNLGTKLNDAGIKPKWTPNAGWKPARYQNPAIRASIYGAKSIADSVGSAFREALRNTAKGSMGPLSGGGGGGGRNSNKTK